MCVVSNIFDYGRYRVPYNTWTQTPGAWDAYKKLIEAGKQFDEVAKEPDCEDPGKAEWMAEIEERLRKLEESKTTRDDL